jgi:hypothetical protein
MKRLLRRYLNRGPSWKNILRVSGGNYASLFLNLRTARVCSTIPILAVIFIKKLDETSGVTDDRNIICAVREICYENTARFSVSFAVCGWRVGTDLRFSRTTQLYYDDVPLHWFTNPAYNLPKQWAGQWLLRLLLHQLLRLQLWYRRGVGLCWWRPQTPSSFAFWSTGT